MAIYGLSTCLFPDIPMEDALEKIATAGFRQVELTCMQGVMGQWTGDPARTRRALDAAGLRARTVHSPPEGFDNAARVEADRIASVEAAVSCFGPACEVGAERVIIHTNSPQSEWPFTEEDYEPSKARTRRSLTTIAERAAKAGLRVAVENLPSRGTPRPGAAIEDVLEMIDGLGDHVGICLDAGHSNGNRRNPAGEARRVAERLFAVHIQDSDGLGSDQHWVPGRGSVDWEGFIAALEETAPDCVRTLEVTGKEGNPNDVLVAVARLRDLWEAL
jgi:sugar phosphate isomerase/epimerase